MDAQALRAALLDLAEYGFVILDDLEDAEQLQRAYPFPTVLQPARAEGRWLVRERKEEDGVAR